MGDRWGWASGTRGCEDQGREQAEPTGGGRGLRASESSVHGGTDVRESGRVSPSVERDPREQAERCPGAGGACGGGRRGRGSGAWGAGRVSRERRRLAWRGRPTRPNSHAAGFPRAGALVRLQDLDRKPGL